MNVGPKISVIIPVKNEEGKIARCLNAIFNQTKKPFEVIVIDGHSVDKTEENSKKFLVNFIYEDYHTRGGACQIGLENTKGDFIAFTDADCIPEKNWLENLVDAFNDQSIVGIGGGIKNIGDGLWEKSINLIMNTFIGSANSIQGRFYKEKRFVNSISGSNSMYRKKDLTAIGGFNVKLPTAEDTDLNNRLLKIGKLLYTPNAIIVHDPNRGLMKFSKRMYQYGYGRSKGKLYDLQIVPPIIGFLLIISLFITTWIFLGMSIIYLIVIGIIGIKFGLQEKDYKYLATVPVVYLVEHISYSIGFWRGLL